MLDDASLLHDGFLDLEAIDDRWLDLAASIKSATKPLVGFYEELLAIRQLLPRMKIDNIVVIENNILSPWVPCYFPYSYAEKLFDYWQTEHEPPAGSPLVQLVQTYGDVKLLKEGKALLLPATLDDERIEIIPFWQGCVVEKEPLTDDIKHIEVGSIEDWEYCLNMTNGVLSSALFLQSGDTVTSWGRDFRSDYWFLGDFLKQTARDGLSFPVLCLTATAVYSGDDDVVNDTIHELGLGKTIIHLGNVKRSNISFDIQRHNPAEVEGRIENAKLDLTLKRMCEYIARGEKVLTYFPYRSQVDQIYNLVNAADHVKIRRYHGQIPSAERKMVERDYKAGTAMGLFCTKAFGMGIDVGDIKHVIHFAPTGTLSDYVQEIGRAARNTEIQGVAHIDYFPSDLRYVRSLNGISEMRQYQLREMLKKICAIQRAKKRRNLLISAETFEYLFKEKDVENRTKSGLLLLSKDLSNKYTFPVLIVRPKAMLSKNYVNVPHEIENEFLKLFGSYCTFQQGIAPRTVPTKNQSRASDMTVYSSGKTFLVDMAGIWENCYPDRSFGMFKKEFFERGISVSGKNYTVAPRVRVEIRYSDDYVAVSQRVETVITAITQIFEKYKNGEIKQFSQKQFEAELAEMLGEKVIPHDKAGMLLDIFTESVNEDAAYSQSRSRVRVLRSRKMPGADETGYFVSSAAYARLPNFFIHQIGQCEVNTEDNSFFRFYPLVQNKQIEIMPLLRFMELLGLATYEIRGGEKAEVFIRINDPEKLERLATSGKYTNGVLQSIQEHHRNNERLLTAFFSADMNDDERWELIEQYFLGNEEYVRRILHIAD